MSDTPTTAGRRLRDEMRGPVLAPGGDAYESARRIWNAMIDRRPALVARCADVDDVKAAVRMARDEDLLLAVRGGGHSVAGNALCDGGLVVDLSTMRDVEVDPGSRTARVQGGATWGDLDRATQAFGLATPGGVVSTTGVGGLTLGGGFGWLSRMHGLASDNLRSAEVVTADGAVVRASEDENPDLFWALRGGGGNFGVVTAFEFGLHEVGPEVLWGPTVHRMEDARDVLATYAEFALAAPPECTVYLDLLTAPPLPFVPEEFHGTKVVSLVQLYVGDPDRGREVLKPLREFGDPIADAVGPTPYTAVQSVMDEVYAAGLRNYWKSHNFRDLPESAIEALADFSSRPPTARSDTLIHHLGGAVEERPLDASAYPHRAARFVVTPGARWEDPERDAECVAWVRELHASLAEDALGGTYVNFATDEDGGRDAYGANYERLADVKERYDPGNLFRVNQNVRPSS